MRADPVDRSFRPEHLVQRIARVGGLISMTRTQGGTVTDSDFLEKCPTGIKGLDEITEGGLPRGRPSLVCGGPGCGKTMLAMEFLVRGARHYDEPGFFVTFDETARNLTKNVASLGFNLGDLVSRKKLLISHIPVQCGEIEEVGQYTLDGLFIRIKHGIDSIGARRVVLDGIESLFSILTNESLLRSEIRRLFLWLREVGVTTVITEERGTQTLTRHGLGIHCRLCHTSGSPSNGSALHKALAYSQVSWIC